MQLRSFGTPAARRLQSAFGYLKRIANGFSQHHCSVMACACSYCALLSVVPLLAVGISLFGFVLGNQLQVVDHAVGTIRNFVPIQPVFLKETLERAVHYRGTAGLLGGIGLVYGAHQTFMVMQPAMNLVWGVRENRKWWRRRVLAVTAAVVTLALLGADVGFTAMAAFELHSGFLSLRLAPISRVAFALLPLLTTTLLFSWLYSEIPSCQVSGEAAFRGAATASVLWELTKIGFAFFVAKYAGFESIYGPLSGLVILVIWVYYSMVILLLGVEVSADFQSRHKELE